MHGNVDDPLEFTGATVHARGPTDWHGDTPGDRPASWIKLEEVSVTQGGVTASDNPGTEYTAPPDSQWSADVTATSGTFVAGRVRVRVVVRLSDRDVDSRPFTETWDETVTLVPG